VVVAAPDYLAAHGTPKTPEALARHRLIHFGVSDGAPEWRFATPEGERRLTLTPCLVTNSAEAALAAAEQGAGLTMVLAYQAREALSAKRLVRVLRRHETPAVPIQLAWPAGRHNPAKLRAFIAFATETVDWRFG
jgi:DNA-binding transcriptional LysR family regulator